MQTAARRVRQNDAPDGSIRGGMKHGASPWPSPVPRTGASEATERIQEKKGALGWSIRGRKKHGISPRTEPSGGEPSATDWSVRGNRDNMTEHPTRGAREQRG